MRLPGRQGVVVQAAPGGTLRYRTGPARGWIPVSRASALLPDAATDVEITPLLGAPVMSAR